MTDVTTCGARRKHAESTCTRPAGWGTPYPGYGACKLHGGSMGPHLVHAERLRVADEEARVAAAYGFGREVSVADALLEGLYAAAGRLDFWNGKVRQLDDLTERGQAGSVDVHHYVRAAERAGRDYQRIATDCARLGIEAKRAAMSKQDSEIALEVINNVVRRLGADPTDARVHGEIVAAIGDAVTAAEAAVRELQP